MFNLGLVMGWILLWLFVLAFGHGICAKRHVRRALAS